MLWGDFIAWHISILTMVYSTELCDWLLESCESFTYQFRFPLMSTKTIEFMWAETYIPQWWLQQRHLSVYMVSNVIKGFHNFFLSIHLMYNPWWEGIHEIPIKTTTVSRMYRYLYHAYCRTPPTTLFSKNAQNHSFAFYLFE